MSSPLIDADDLGIYLNDSSINNDRADVMIGYAQALCESVVSPLPSTAAVVVARVAGRGYVTTTQPRGPQMAAAGSPFGSGSGGVWLTQTDRTDLLRLAAAANGGSSGGGFSIDMLPAGYVAPPTVGYGDEFGYSYGDGWLA